MISIVKVVEMTASLMNGPTDEQMLATLEAAGRVCYKSEDKIADGSAEKFIGNIIKRGHESVLEHVSMTMLFTVDRGVTHEIVRHRIASYSQESTRYCNYGNEKFGNAITVCRPTFWTGGADNEKFDVWMDAMISANSFYQQLINLGATPQEARTVLPQSTKADIVVTMNIREWRHFFRLRCSKAAHPDMRTVALQALCIMHDEYSVVFDDIYEEFFPSTTMEVPGT